MENFKETETILEVVLVLFDSLGGMEFLFGLVFDMHLRRSLFFGCADGSLDVIGGKVNAIMVPLRRPKREKFPIFLTLCVMNMPWCTVEMRLQLGVQQSPFAFNVSKTKL